MSETKNISLSGLRTFLKPLMRLINRKAETWDELKEKPFGSEIKEYDKEILPLTNSITTDNSTFNLTDVLIEGQTYIVTWDGVNYECIARNYDGYIMLGNNAIYEYDNDITTDTGEPFAMETEEGNANGWIYLAEGDTSEHSISITAHIVEETITKLDGKYLDFDTSNLVKSVNGNTPDDYGDVYLGVDSLYGNLPISKGGTGAATVANARGNLGLGYTSGAVPIANGGTGATTVAAARNALGLGNTSGALPIANGGTGATTAAAALTNLGVKTYIDNEIAEWVGDETVATQISTANTTMQNYVSTEVETINTMLSSMRNGIVLVDQINGHTYLVSMRDGELVSSIGTQYIEITTLPTKTSYVDGDIFDPTGMVVTAIGYDGTSKEITSFTYPETGLVEGTTSINISYIEGGIKHTESVAITVGAFDPAVVLVDFYYTDNSDGTYILTGWKQTYNGESSTELIIPNNTHIIL